MDQPVDRKDWTTLTGCHVADVLKVRLRFGQPQHIEWVDGGLTRYWFAPGQRFGFAWWARLSPRRQVAGFAVAEALASHHWGYRLACIDRVVQVHAFLGCRCVGKDRGVVGRADELVESLRQSNLDPCVVPSIYYRLAAHALRVGQAPRRIDRDQLLCFLEEQAHAN